jgi:hypothetical protein
MKSGVIADGDEMLSGPAQVASSSNLKAGSVAARSAFSSTLLAHWAREFYQSYCDAMVNRKRMPV